MSGTVNNAFQQDAPLLETSEIIELVRKCSEGETAALQEFFEHYSSDIYNFPIKVFHLDEDSASDFFLYAYERLREGSRFRSFQGRSSFRTWFYTVLRNLVIDWMRTIREVQTVSYNRTDERGNEYRMIENTPDPRSEEGGDDSLLQLFNTNIQKLGMELRVVFKLSYIYYLELARDELAFIVEKSGRPPAEIQLFVADLKHKLSEKELRNLDAEDKITSLYISIMELKSKRDRILMDANGKEVQDPMLNATTDFELNRIDRSLEKKYMQRERLLEKKEKGHFVVRTPYKYVAELLNIPEGSISVQMMRALEKLKGR